ncbi:hypothetical protein AMTR_s00003p00148700 [Amborella trichopoda]|uniref:Uncharacterized protein n=1 Tax=Amborella trichopoda TaxID=13333 RepID=W1P5M2_AMBTC|nr:hypothetical protein AMTR_s00003p00148700 [Amborella trichopoda]
MLPALAYISISALPTNTFLRSNPFLAANSCNFEPRLSAPVCAQEERRLTTVNSSGVCSKSLIMS